MVDKRRQDLWLAGGVIALVVWMTLTAAAPPAPNQLPMMAVFVGLITFSLAYSFPISEGSVSLMPMMVGAAYMILGKVATGWVVILSVTAHAVVRVLRARRNPEIREPHGKSLVEVTALNTTMHVFGMLAGALAFEAVGGNVPLQHLDLVAVVTGAAAYLGVNYALAAAYLAMRDRAMLLDYLQALPTVILLEGGPLIFSPLVAVIYNRLGLAYFTLFALALMLFSYISHNLAVKSRRLRRRVQELSSLQAVGHALSASLDIEVVVCAIYEQVTKLMPTPSFYVGLYDSELGEVSFPLIMNNGERLHAHARQARHGLTEYLLETRKPLLLTEDVAAWIEEQGLEVIGREAACWVGTPIVAGDEALGVIAVQSYDTPGAYDRSHLEILTMIADQAAIAVQNARLYERTDEALARRVQELDSVLRTTQEGVLLVDRDWRVLAVNPALAELINVAQTALIRRPLDAERQKGNTGGGGWAPDGAPETSLEGAPLIDLIGYTPTSFKEACERLLQGESEQIQSELMLPATHRYVERTLTPVREREGGVTGWLLVFRDLREELELKQLREDMTDMLVHDLKSPLSIVTTTLQMLPEIYHERDDDRFEQLVGISSRSGDRVLQLIEDILTISQLEIGQFPMKPEPVMVEELFEDVTSHFNPVATKNQIRLTTELAEDLPQVNVDRSLILRVLYNLTDNALKFTRSRETIVLRAARQMPPLRVVPRGSAGPKSYVEITMEDAGPGIPEEEMSRVFEKFQQVSGVRGRKRGTGLGLPFCKLVVEQHGGTIWVESEVGRGSTFHLTLPAA